MLTIDTSVNGQRRVLRIAADDLLIDVLRDRLHLRGVKRSCDVQICGTCTVLLDGRAVSACTTLAAEMDGHDIRTVEGLADGDRLSPLQEAFIAEGAAQCGFCTPGFLMSATALLDEHPEADGEAVAAYLSGNLCRCGGYNRIAAALERARSAP